MGNKQSRRQTPNNPVASMGNRLSRSQIPNNPIAPMDTQQSRRQTPNNPIAPMDTQQSRHRVPEIQFRVLIMGRANAGKSSILQRVCDTTGSPVIYRGNEEVRGPTFLSATLISHRGLG